MSYFRSNVELMSGYVPGEQPRRDGVVKLNTNESPYPPSPKVVEAIGEVACDRLRLYPDPLATRFRDAASSVLGVPSDWLLATNGSDEALTILARACLDGDDRMAAPTPSYPMYRVLAQLQGVVLVERPFTAECRLPRDFCAGVKLALVPNPNSPTGSMVPPVELLDLARSAHGLLVVDEAYVDFADENCVAFIRDCDRLVVTRSLSKSYALAGLRFGYIVAQPHVIQTLRKVKEPYNCDTLSIAAASAAILDQPYFLECRRRILATRGRLERQLSQLGFDVTPSHANFVWARHTQSVRAIYEHLQQENVLVRYFQFEGYGEGLRISVGTDAEVDRLFAVLQTLV
jgi:histidinol-phosphate aminotransferase